MYQNSHTALQPADCFLPIVQHLVCVDAVACRASHFIELPCQTSFCLFFTFFFISLLSVAWHLAPTDVCDSSSLLLELRLLVCNFVRPQFDAQLAHLCCFTQ